MNKSVAFFESCKLIKKKLGTGERKGGGGYFGMPFIFSLILFCTTLKLAAQTWQKNMAQVIINVIKNVLHSTYFAYYIILSISKKYM